MSYSLQVLGGVALVDYLAMQQGGTERDYLARLLWSGGGASKGRHPVRSAAPWVRRL